MSADPKHPVAPRIRRAFLEAWKEKSRREGKTFSEIMLDEIDEHGLLAVMGMVSKFVERTGTVNVTGAVKHDHTHVELSETGALIEGMLADRTEVSSEEPGEVRPLLPH